MSNLSGLVGTMDTDRTQTHRLWALPSADPRVATLTSVNLVLCCFFFFLHVHVPQPFVQIFNIVEMFSAAPDVAPGHHKCHIMGAALRFTRRSLASTP